MRNPLISIIVPCYNQAAYLPEALDSCIAQTYGNWQCIVVNDASTDNTNDIALQYRKDHPGKFEVISFPDNKGVCVARNTAIRFSNGEYIIPLDADDRLHPDYLSKTIEAMQAHPGVKIVFTDCRYFGTPDAAIGERHLFTLPELAYENRLQCTALFSKRDFNATDGYRVNMDKGYEDWDFWVQMVKKETDLYRIAEPLFEVRIGLAGRNTNLLQNEVSEQQMRKQIIKNNWKFYKKYAPELLPKHPLRKWASRIKQKLTT